MVSRSWTSDELGAAAQLVIVVPQTSQAIGINRDCGIIGGSRVLGQGSGSGINGSDLLLDRFETGDRCSLALGLPTMQIGEARRARRFRL